MADKIIFLLSSSYAKALVIYLLAVGVSAIIITIYDKHCARAGKWRISENTLMLTGLLGGALPMLITMKIIRHKTRHKKFMVGLPLEIILHILLFVIIIFKCF